MSQTFSDVEVEIIGQHPHAGKCGQPTGLMREVDKGGEREPVQYFEVRFPDGTSTFASFEQMRLVRPFRGEARKGYRIR